MAVSVAVEMAGEVLPEIALARAEEWLNEKIALLDHADTVIAFGRDLFPLLQHQDRPNEINTGIEDQKKIFALAYSPGRPRLALAELRPGIWAAVTVEEAHAHFRGDIQVYKWLFSKWR